MGGCEPEAILTTDVELDGVTKSLTFVSLERQGGIMTYDTTDPTAPKYQDYFNPSIRTLGDGPESFQYIPADKSPICAPLLAAAHPLVGATTLYKISESATARTDDGACTGELGDCKWLTEASNGHIVHKKEDLCAITECASHSAAGGPCEVINPTVNRVSEDANMVTIIVATVCAIAAMIALAFCYQYRTNSNAMKLELDNYKKVGGGNGGRSGV